VTQPVTELAVLGVSLRKLGERAVSERITGPFSRFFIGPGETISGMFSG
jgi:hypothetical protein